MKPADVKTIEDAKTIIEERGATHVHLGITALSGEMRGKCIAKDKFFGCLESGVPLSHGINACDFNDTLYDAYIGETQRQEGEGRNRIVPGSCREIPWEDPRRNLFFLMEFDDEAAAFDARRVYGRVLDKANAMGLRPFHACEFEFVLFKETIESALEKSFNDLTLYNPISAYCSTMRHLESSEFFSDCIDICDQLDIGVDAVHWEYSPGAGEVVLHYEEGLRAPDNAAIYKTFIRAHAKRRNLLMSFMARWNEDAPGNSCHAHISLRDRDGNPVFDDPSDKLGMSQTMRYFLGGMQKAMPELILMMAPNYNSYKRFAAGIQTPLAATWGTDNRTTALRVLLGNPHSQRIENRVGGGDANPYLVLACAVGSGLWGIENEVEPTEEFVGNNWENLDQVPQELRFPSTFTEAIERFRNSALAKELFGEEFVRVYADTRHCQDMLFRSSVSELERKFFLEMA